MEKKRQNPSSVLHLCSDPRV